MYRIVKTRRAWWPVTWAGVTEDGEQIENRIEMRFRILKVDEFAELMREAGDVQEAANQHAAVAGDAEHKRTSILFAEVVAKLAEDWRGVAAENGEIIAWSPDNLAMLLNEPRVFDRVVAAFRAVTSGQEEIRQGN